MTLDQMAIAVKSLKGEVVLTDDTTDSTPTAPGNIRFNTEAEYMGWRRKNHFRPPGGR